MNPHFWFWTLKRIHLLASFLYELNKSNSLSHSQHGLGTFFFFNIVASPNCPCFWIDLFLNQTKPNLIKLVPSIAFCFPPFPSIPHPHNFPVCCFLSWLMPSQLAHSLLPACGFPQLPPPPPSILDIHPPPPIILPNPILPIPQPPPTSSFSPSNRSLQPKYSASLFNMLFSPQQICKISKHWLWKGIYGGLPLIRRTTSPPQKYSPRKCRLLFASRHSRLFPPTNPPQFQFTSIVLLSTCLLPPILPYLVFASSA